MNKIKHNESGFGTVEALLLFVILAIIGFVSWYVWHAGNSINKSTSTPQPSITNLTAVPKTTAPVVADTNAGYLVIKEWDIKIKMKEASKATYVYTKAPAEDKRDAGIRDSSIELKVKPEYLKDKTCKVSAGFSRYKTITDDFFIKLAHKVGNYYFLGEGSPYRCDNDADDALNISIRSDMTNLEVL